MAKAGEGCAYAPTIITSGKDHCQADSVNRAIQIHPRLPPKTATHLLGIVGPESKLSHTPVLPATQPVHPMAIPMPRPGFADRWAFWGRGEEPW